MIIPSFSLLYSRNVKTEEKKNCCNGIGNDDDGRNERRNRRKREKNKAKTE
jgi:hypothetical protein